MFILRGIFQAFIFIYWFQIEIYSKVCLGKVFFVSILSKVNTSLWMYLLSIFTVKIWHEFPLSEAY